MRYRIVIDDLDKKIIANKFNRRTNVKNLSGLKSHCAKYIKLKKYKKIPKKVGSGAKEVTPLATVATLVNVISLVLTIDETISGIKS